MLGGGNLKREDLEPLAQKISQTENFSIATARHLVNSYGADYEKILALAREDKSLRELLLADLPNIAAEVIYAVRYELALTIADVLARRTRIAMLGNALECVNKIADLMARELGWETTQKTQQIAAFKTEYEREYQV